MYRHHRVYCPHPPPAPGGARAHLLNLQHDVCVDAVVQRHGQGQLVQPQYLRLTRRGRTHGGASGTVKGGGLGTGQQHAHRRGAYYSFADDSGGVQRSSGCVCTTHHPAWCCSVQGGLLAHCLQPCWRTPWPRRLEWSAKWPLPTPAPRPPSPVPGLLTVSGWWSARSRNLRPTTHDTPRPSSTSSRLPSTGRAPARAQTWRRCVVRVGSAKALALFMYFASCLEPVVYMLVARSQGFGAASMRPHVTACVAGRERAREAGDEPCDGRSA